MQGDVMELEEEQSLGTEEAVKYLSLYVADAEWRTHIGTLWQRLLKKHGEAKAKEEMRRTIACTVLLPIFDTVKIPDRPENLLFWIPTWQQYKERDWFAELAVVMQRDRQIQKWRNQALSLGVVSPLDYSPITRQACNWLYEHAEDNGAIKPDSKRLVIEKINNLVYAYGGTVVCNVFTKNSDIDHKILSWRTNYFFEHLIYESYTQEQVLKIKKQELKKTNPSLIKHFITEERNG